MHQHNYLDVFLFFIVFLFLATLKSHRTYAGGGDQGHYLLIAESLLADGDLRMENQYPAHQSFLPKYEISPHVIPTPSGSFFPLHDIGLPILMLPLLSAVHVVIPKMPVTILIRLHMDELNLCIAFFSFQTIIISALLVVAIFHYFMLFGFSEKQSFWLSLLAILTPPLITEEYLFFTEIYSATVLVAMALIYRLGGNSRASAILYGLGVFVLSWLHIKNLLLVAALCGLWGLSFIKARQVFTALFPIVCFMSALLIRLFINHHYFGVYVLTGGWDHTRMTFANVSHSIAGLLFDREGGLLFCNPIFFLTLTGLWYCWWTRDSWWTFEGVLVAAYLVSILPFDMWWAGWAPAARHIVPIIPFLWVPIAKVIQHIEDKGNLIWRWFVRSLIFISIAISLILWQKPQWGWISGKGLNPWMSAFSMHGREWQFALPSILTQNEFPNKTLLAWGIIFLLISFLSCIYISATAFVAKRKSA